MSVGNNCQRRLEFLLGPELARVYLAGECYLANARLAQHALSDERNRRDKTAALDQWIVQMKAAIAHYESGGK
jgi:hypothetical protein